MSTPLRILFAGGGTGGHIYPALAMAFALRQRGAADNIVFVAADQDIDRSILEPTGESLEFLPGTGLRGASLPGRMRVPLLLVRAIVGGLRILRRVRPDAVVGTGGYASAAMVIAAIVTRTPRILQEQNSVPGLVNRRLARFADLVLLAYESSKNWMPRRVPVEVIGNPLREFRTIDRDRALRHLGLDPHKRVVLVVGGSRGARSLCDAAVDASDALGNKGVQLLILAGRARAEETRRRAMECIARGKHTTGHPTPGHAAVHVFAYLDDMALAYAVADVAVARAGASSVFELAARRIPTVFVPYPHAADDHQRRNVAPLAARGGCLVVDDADFDARIFARQVSALLDDRPLCHRMTAAMGAWVREDAAARAAAGIVAAVKKKTRSGERAGRRVETVM